ncbi:F-box domain-containing protein [Mycena venus]|uniref:F-box domain-containing protein n=1 Tax=Mycena venus TaxID=2733690 RepID=A0A8H6YVK7_9AGAR|nr:F-box domain-containing protein [Mycena venus]
MEFESSVFTPLLCLVLANEANSSFFFSFVKVPARFGLLDSSPARWFTLTTKLRELNASAGAGAAYKLIFFGRHGQGYHNMAEDKYGTEAWNDYWGMLYGDGGAHLGPCVISSHNSAFWLLRRLTVITADPELSGIGKAQAADANETWKAERAAGIPLPERLYCSPMTRAMQTNVITFDGVSDTCVVVLENCREEYGWHTCNKRNTRTYIRTAFPKFEIEDGFTEKDELWEVETQETKTRAAARARTVLDRIFRDDKDVLFVSITTHGGIIHGFLHAMGRPIYQLPTGGVLPVVVKATNSV